MDVLSHWLQYHFWGFAITSLEWFMFDNSVLGHTEIRRRLLERVNSNKIFGSLLFVGPEGVGKRRVALELAQREICFSRSACGVCEGCKLFKTDPLPNEFPNLLRIAPEGKAGIIKVSVIRGSDLVEGGVIAWAHSAPPPGCHRWVVIEDAHRLNKASANILLKTLEEPPPGTFFLLITHRPDSVLPTIQSRSERIAFAPLSSSDMSQIALGHGWGEPELASWAAVSNGTLKYLDRDIFLRACSQIDAWVSIMEGASFKDVSNHLLPDKQSDVAQSQQAAQALEQLMIVLGERIRLLNGMAGRLAQWGQRLGSLPKNQSDLQKGYRYTLEAMRALARNVAPETIMRKISLALH
jgi:DNA polymerase-3 subunit delta'